MGAAALPIMIATTVLSTAAGVAGSVAQGQAAKQQANYQAAVARNNAIIAERKAADARERGEVEAQQQRLRTQQLIGRQRASAAGRGVQVDEGSALDVTADTAALGELDALTIRSNAEREALGFEAEGRGFQAEGELAQARGRTAQTDALFEAGGTFLSGASRVSERWYQLR